MLLEKGSKGRTVREIQTLLDFHGFWTYHTFTEYFGDITEKAVIKFQKAKGLLVDGKVGDDTYRKLLKNVDADAISFSDSLPIKDTDNKLEYKGTYLTQNGLRIDRAYLDSDEYITDYGKIEPVNFIIHDTAGWDNPYNTIHSWNIDKRGRVATQYCIGGLNVLGNTKYDGKVVESFPNNYLGWHTGQVGSFEYVSKRSVGVELNNFGFLKEVNGKFYTYTNVEVPEDQICDLGFKFKGHQFYHKYGDKQIENLGLLIKHIRKIYPQIPLGDGLPALLRRGISPQEAFSFNEEAYWGRIHGTWTHTNVRSDKLDCSPQPALIELLKTIK